MNCKGIGRCQDQGCPAHYASEDYMRDLIEKLRLMAFESVDNDEATMLHEAADALEAKAVPVGELNIEEAAKKLAECMDYPWEYMPAQGRDNMRKHAQAVIEAAGAAYQRQSGVMPPAEILAYLFIGCPLPKTVRVDPCALDPDYPHRFGTNLLTWREAKTMFEEMLARLNGAGSHE